MADKPLLIPGVTTRAHPLQVRAAYDDQLIATLDTADAAAVEQALATAYGLYRDRERWLSGGERIRILQKTAKLMTAEREELAHVAAEEGGKPLMDSLVEVDRAIDGVHNCIECARGEAGREIPMDINAASANRLAMTRREPVGVVVAVSAFNHPLNLIVHQGGPAVASGCPVIVKPAEDTPLSCYRFIELLHQAGLPPEWAQALVASDLEVASQLVTEARVGFFSFIGSAKVGWMLRSRLAPGARCALEHGGAAPVIVAADADLDSVLPALAKGGFYHAGQVCVSVQRVYAHKSIARQLADELAGLAQALRVGDPTAEDTEVGPLIRPREVERVAEWVSEAVNAGAECLTGGKSLSESCYAPTVLFNPPDDTQVSQLEIFGPVVCVYEFDDIDAALARANSLPVAFQAAVYTRDLDTALKCYRHLDASAVMVNDHTAFRVDWMPFAGLRQSGIGTGGIPYTYEDMTVEKLLVVKSDQL